MTLRQIDAVSDVLAALVMIKVRTWSAIYSNAWFSTKFMTWSADSRCIVDIKIKSECTYPTIKRRMDLEK